MSESVRVFYDELAPVYHHFFADWSASVRRQGAVLDRLIRAELGDGSRMILDAACGIGTQAIGLALNGHQVRGTDLSPVAVERARHEAARVGVDLVVSVADLRTLAEQIEDSFDVVLACDNALPHLLTDDDLRRAVANMTAKLCPGGLFIVSTRDYDSLVLARPSGEGPRLFDTPTGKRISFQAWEWAGDGRRYRVHQFLLHETADDWRTEHFATNYRALLRDDLNRALTAAGLIEPRWHEPDDSGYFQSLLTACRP